MLQIALNKIITIDYGISGDTRVLMIHMHTCDCNVKWLSRETFFVFVVYFFLREIQKKKFN